MISKTTRQRAVCNMQLRNSACSPFGLAHAVAMTLGSFTSSSAILLQTPLWQLSRLPRSNTAFGNTQ